MMAATGSVASRLAPVLRPRVPLRRPATLRRPWVAVTAMVALVLWSVVLKLPGLRVFYWIDEGISLGVASHPLGAIPRLLRQDGSPPLYYVLLHLWMGLFGTSEPATHALSLVFGLLCVPAALWAT